MAINFRLPGPTPLPPAVVAALQREMIPHRGPAFQALYCSILARAKEIHRTDGDVLIWPASGSAGWEVAITNLLSPGDPVLATIVGDFGARFASVAEAFGLDVRRLECPWGSALTPALLRAALDRHPDVKAVLLTHNETSTGITNPLRDLAAVVRDHGALVLVDAVSSAAGLPLLMDDWGLDFVLSGSQKAWMCPPGLLITAAGLRAWDAYARSRFPKFFWDLRAAREAAQKGMTPATPPLSLLYAFDAALDIILAEGVEQVWRRHHELGERMRQGVRALGLRLFGDEAYASDTVTAVVPPPGIPAKTIVWHLEQDHGVIVAGGQAHLADAIVRIGHMGWVTAEDIDHCLGALRAVLQALTAREPVAAAQ